MLIECLITWMPFFHTLRYVLPNSSNTLEELSIVNDVVSSWPRSSCLSHSDFHRKSCKSLHFTKKQQTICIYCIFKKIHKCIHQCQPALTHNGLFDIYISPKYNYASVPYITVRFIMGKNSPYLHLSLVWFSNPAQAQLLEGYKLLAALIQAASRKKRDVCLINLFAFLVKDSLNVVVFSTWSK